jgi:hypothetical protein
MPWIAALKPSLKTSHLKYFGAPSCRYVATSATRAEGKNLHFVGIGLAASILDTSQR